MDDSALHHLARSGIPAAVARMVAAAGAAPATFHIRCSASADTHLPAAQPLPADRTERIQALTLLADDGPWHHIVLREDDHITAGWASTVPPTVVDITSKAAVTPARGMRAELLAALLGASAPPPDDYLRRQLLLNAARSGNIEDAVMHPAIRDAFEAGALTWRVLAAAAGDFELEKRPEAVIATVLSAVQPDVRHQLQQAGRQDLIDHVDQQLPRP